MAKGEGTLDEFTPGSSVQKKPPEVVTPENHPARFPDLAFPLKGGPYGQGGPRGRGNGFILKNANAGPPVDWEHCIFCGKEMGQEERFRGEKDGKVGVAHKWCIFENG